MNILEEASSKANVNVVNIPSSDAVLVTSIGDRAFFNCNQARATISKSGTNLRRANWGPAWWNILAAAVGLLVVLNTETQRAAAATNDSVGTKPAKASIPWSELGAKVGAGYQGDGLAIVRTAEGARLRCVFQRLEAEAAREGLWLTSTATNAPNNRFRVVATALGRV